MEELSIYVHIPFCVQKCAYCDFLSGPVTVKKQKEYSKALLTEIKLVGETGPAFCWNEQLDIDWIEKKEHTIVKSIFFGGGTPSIMDSDDICCILNAIREQFIVCEDAEITIEANPGTVTVKKIETYRTAGINRISLGLQSTNDDELLKLGRIHTYKDFIESYSIIRKQGFENVNVDLMFGLPGQTLTSYLEGLKKVIALSPEHISAYGLIIEEGTPFYQLYHRHEEMLPSEESTCLMDSEGRALLKAAGYMRYEISNYAKLGFECKHNKGYWLRNAYLGFGIGSASFYGNARYKNTEKLECYIKELLNCNLTNEHMDRLQEILGIECNFLTSEEQMEEFVYLGLRLIGGRKTEDFFAEFNKKITDVFEKQIDDFVEKGLLKIDSSIYLTEEGIAVSNYVMSEFLFD